MYQVSINMKSKVTQNAKTQIDKANGLLLELVPEITATDRDMAQKELDLSEPTITRYLNGKAKKIDTALELIKFFKKRIADRERALAA